MRDPSDRVERLEALERWTRHLAAGLLVAAGIFVFFGTSAEGFIPAREGDTLHGSFAGNPRAMEARLASLELQNQRFKQLGALLLILTGTGLLVRRLLPLRTLEANRLVLRDGRGRLRIGLTPDAGLVMLDRNQRPRVELSAMRDGAALKLFDATRQRRVELTELPDGAVLAISDCSQHPRAALLGVSQDGPSLSLVDGKGAGAMSVGGEGPNLVLLDREKGRTTLEVTDEGPELVLADAHGNPCVVVTDERRNGNGRRCPTPRVATA